MTNIMRLAEYMRLESDTKVSGKANSGLAKQMVQDERTRHELDMYVSYATGDHDWDGAEGVAWDDVSGNTFDNELWGGNGRGTRCMHTALRLQ